MVKPLSLDLRTRIKADVEGGMSYRSAARRFGVSPSAVVKLMKRYRATGSREPGQIGGHREPILANERAWILARIAEQPDITLRALADETFLARIFALWDRGVDPLIWRPRKNLSFTPSPGSTG